jgi:hypothetical protein
MTPDSSGLTAENAEKSLALASTLFPEEEWVQKEANIWVAKSRLREEKQEPAKWEREMSQVRILTSRGSVAYFLPEVKTKMKTSPRCADLVLDGVILEMKTTGGTRATIGGEFRLAYKQGATLAGEGPNRPEHSVFLRLLSDLEVDSIRAKIAGELKGRTGKGRFTCYFEHTGKLYSWTYEELRSIIGKKMPGPASAEPGGR